MFLKLSPQGVEEEAEQYSEEEAPAAAGEPKPPPADGPVQAEEGQEGGDDAQEEEEAGGQSKEESKAEEKGNLAGERQSGDGQVRRTGSVLPVEQKPSPPHKGKVWWATCGQTCGPPPPMPQLLL